ncbi:MAG: hypothetical protein Kow0099_23190 [Candidatus Abyssubacteria bacterium]
MKYIESRFSEVGLAQPAIEWFEMHWWNPKRVELRLLPEERSLRVKPVWYSGATGEDGITGESEYCGYGMPHQFGSARGKIAVIDSRILLHFWPTYRFFRSYESALAAGATGVVVIIDAPGDLIPIFTAEEEKYDNPLPFVMVSRSDGALLKERIMAGRSRIRLCVEAESGIRKTGDVVGTLRGVGDEYLIVGAHHDSVYQGAVDNAGGVAALLALASELAGRADAPRKNIVFATHPGHELLIGAREFIKRRRDILSKTVAYITLDGIGSDNYEEADGRIVKTGRDEARGAFVSPNPLLARMVLSVIEKYGLKPAALLPADVMCPNEDLEGRFFEAAVPIIDIIGKPIWYHTEEDTPDKCSADQLERGALAHLEILERIDGIPATEIRSADRQPLDAEDFIEPRAGAKSPEIEFAYLPDPIRAGEPSLLYVTRFDDREGVLIDMNWSIGGEEASKGPALLHVFERPGRYVISLAVRNTCGAVGRYERTVTVS